MKEGSQGTRCVLLLPDVYHVTMREWRLRGNTMFSGFDLRGRVLSALSLVYTPLYIFIIPSHLVKLVYLL